LMRRWQSSALCGLAGHSRSALQYVRHTGSDTAVVSYSVATRASDGVCSLARRLTGQRHDGAGGPQAQAHALDARSTQYSHTFVDTARVPTHSEVPRGHVAVAAAVPELAGACCILGAAAALQPRASPLLPRCRVALTAPHRHGDNRQMSWFEMTGAPWRGGLGRASTSWQRIHEGPTLLLAP
jgi:hypothetical protein